MSSRLKFIKILKSESGVSLAMILVALAIVTSGTLVLIDLSKSNKLVFTKARSSSFSELERKRIGAVLGDKTTCTLSNNFGSGTKTPLQANMPSLVTADNATPFIAKDSLYFNKMFKVTNIQTRQITVGNPNYTTYLNLGLINSKSYELVVTYSPTNAGSIGAGKPMIVRVPMYMKLDASGKVSDCFALVGNTNADQIVSLSCSPATASAYKNSYTTNTTAGTINECNHTATFDGVAAATDCSAVSGSSVSTQTFLSKFTVSGNVLSTSSGTDCSTGMLGFGTCSADQAAYNLTSSGVQCAYPGGNSVAGHDGGCASGELLYHGVGGSSSCVSVNCSTATQFVSAVTSAGTTCFGAPNTSCGSSQYVSTFNQTGSDVCSPLPAFTGACGTSYYGISVSKSTTTNGNQLECGALNKAKSCPSPSATTFITSFNNSTGGSANCTTY